MSKRYALSRRTFIKSLGMVSVLNIGSRPLANAMLVKSSASGSFLLPPLGYAYDALEPYIDTRTMLIHHTRHHQGYVDNLNRAVQGTTFANMTIEAILANLDKLPDNIRMTVRNNGGGYANHRLYWEIMSPNGGGQPRGALASAIASKYGDFAAFKARFIEVAANHFGSGWAWLASDASKTLFVFATPNQDSPLMQGLVPLLGIDLWEHAYYLLHQNRRGDYLDNFWSVVNWDQVSTLYENI